MAEHYGTAILPARPHSPKDKVFVEGSVGVVSTWTLAALRNRQFLPLMELNEAIREKLEAFNHKHFQKWEGHYPSRILADKIYRNRENLSYCKEHGIRLSGPALGRPRKEETKDKSQDYQDECERVEAERRFSLAKRKCGMGLVTAKLQRTAAHVISMSILVLNLRRIQCTLLRMPAWLLVFWGTTEKPAIVQ